MIIAQISDPHITLGENEASAALERAVRHLVRSPAPPDVVLVTGDCVNNGRVAEYERFRELIRPLTMPVFVIPGNHDNRAALQEAFGVQGESPLTGFVQYVVENWPVRLIALDTNIPGQDGGVLCAERLQWLEERLLEAPERPTMLLMHHPPFRTGLAVHDGIGLAEAEKFGAIVARHPQIEGIVTGHVHFMMVRRYQGTVAMTCPSTMHQMFPDLGRPERLAVMMEPPVCLFHVWREASGLAVHTSLIGDHGPIKEIHDGERWLG